MPTVPRLSGPTVSQQVSPNMRIADTETPEDRKSQFGDLGRAAFGAAKQAKDNADQTAMIDAQRKLTELETNLLYNPETGAYNKRGKAAFGTPEEVNEKYTAGVAEIESTLSNDEQKMAFKKAYTLKQGEINRSLSKHVSSEIRQYDNESTEAFLQTEREAALKNPFDLDRVQTSITRQQVEIAKFGLREGKPADWIDNKAKTAASKTHAGVIENLLNSETVGADVKAKEYFEANQENILGEDISNVSKQIETATLRGESQRQADSIFAAGGSLASQMEKAKQIQDPELRDATTDRVKQNYQMKEMVEKDRIEKSHINAANIIDQTGSVDKIPVSEWNKFTVAERSSLKSYAAAKASGKDIVTNLQVYQDLKAIATANPNEFMKTDLVKSHLNDLSGSDMKQMIDIQAKMREGKGGADDALNGFRTADQAVNDLLLKAGIKKDTDRAIMLRDRLDKEVQKEGQETGKKVSTARVKEIAADLMVEQASSWFSTKYKFESAVKTDADLQDLSYDDIPESEKRLIRETIRKKRLFDDDSTYLQLYKEMLKGS